MSTVMKSRSAAQTAALVSGRVLAAAVSFVWMAVVARALSPNDMGVFSLGMSLAVALSVLSDLGLPMIVSDRVARHPSDARGLVARASSIRLRASLGTGLLLLAMFQLASDGPLGVPLFLGLSISASAVYSTATAALRGLGTIGPDVLNEVLSRILVLAIGAFALFMGYGVVGVAAAFAISDLCSAGALSEVLRRRAPPGRSLPAHLTNWRTVLPLAIALLVGSLHTRIDVWLLAMLEPSSTVAHYAVPARVAEALLIPAGVAAALVLPLTASAEHHKSRGKLAFRYVGAVTLLVTSGALVVALLAPRLLFLAFGEQYRSDGPVLQVLCLAAIPTSISVGLAPIVAILRRTVLFRCVLLGLVINVAGCLALIPGHQGLGAAWASVVSMSVVALGLIFALRELDNTPADKVR